MRCYEAKQRQKYGINDILRKYQNGNGDRGQAQPRQDSNFHRILPYQNWLSFLQSTKEEKDQVSSLFKPPKRRFLERKLSTAAITSFRSKSGQSVFVK
jgi:hypothetical protein